MRRLRTSGGTARLVGIDPSMIKIKGRKPALGGLMEVPHEFFAVIVAKERIENLCHLHGRAADYRSRENVAGFSYDT
jgi:hypothetical protein